MRWRRVQLAEFLDEGGIDIQTGPFGTQLRASDYTSEGIPVINVRNMGYGDLRPDKLEFVPSRVASRLSRHLLETYDIVFGRKGAVDRHLLVSESEAGWMQGSDCIRLRILTDELDAAFLSFVLRLPSHRQWMIAQCSNKATMASLNQDVIARISIRLPDRETQTRIASILSAYDDLIENNRRRIQLLEQAARLLYKEWFVHLRFPGHEHVNIIDGVPEGWEKRTIADVCETVGGGTPSTRVADYWGGDITWVVPSDVTKNDCLVLLDSERKITERGLRKSSARMVPAETILMTSRASVGFFALMDREVCTNQGFINIIPHEDTMRMYLLFNLISRVSEIRGNAKGTTYPEISKGRFREMDIIVPSKTLVNEFAGFVGDMIRQIRFLKRSTRKLEAARDLLLPRLMNGEVVV
jgi:type I restriction enzyme S subunit